ncbi:ATP-binding cassette domain-containing protein [Celerinatantimonas sp. MCCC 1A17872]|uniref:ATP-binding cassette domain-containing protein n=1 Tax=Celerinatantimonas sp. MCCC 1A17872 TaxID=3177514 RepID=UPI0038C728F5
MIEFKQVEITKAKQHCIIDDWQIEAGKHVCVIAGDNSPSLIADWLFEKASLTQGQVTGLPSRIGIVSLSVQQQLYSEQKDADETDLTNEVDPGSSVLELLYEINSNSEQVEQAIVDCGLEKLRDRGFFLLSTGETRRLMLARAILTNPQLLVLDEPYAGLDKGYQQQLSGLLERLSSQYTILMITSRDKELPECFTKISLFDEGRLHSSFDRQQWLEHPLRLQWQALAGSVSKDLAKALQTGDTVNDKLAIDPLFAIHDGRVAYHDGLIFENLNWQIRPNQHWQVRGPNGCGKSTLLNLIFGDHPQCYSNQIDILGHRRGSGESIWEVKQRIGMVSSSLHLQYRINAKAVDVVLSGFYDSIGLYQQPSASEREQAMNWLKLLHMDNLAKAGFQSLSYGQQRLLLIARALIKRPVLLLLDEPCQGLDYLNRKIVLQALSIIAKQGLTQMVYVSHHDDEAIDGIEHFVDFIPAADGQGYHPQVSSNVQ